VPIAAIAVLAANDHWGKAAFPGLVTGKLSDVAGLAFFPLLLVALAERVAAPSRRLVTLCVLATGVTFTLVKCWSPAHAAYAWGLGLLQAPFRGAWLPVHLEMDRTDLWALPVLVLPWLLGVRRCP
jgi:hypothetical protein